MEDQLQGFLNAAGRVSVVQDGFLGLARGAWPSHMSIDDEGA